MVSLLVSVAGGQVGEGAEVVLTGLDSKGLTSGTPSEVVGLPLFARTHGLRQPSRAASAR